MIANIASDDALILPHHANPAGLNFRERQVLAEHTEWLEHTLVSSSARGESRSGQQQQQVQPKDGRKNNS